MALPANRPLWCLLLLLVTVSAVPAMAAASTSQTHVADNNNSNRGWLFHHLPRLSGLFRSPHSDITKQQHPSEMVSGGEAHDPVAQQNKVSAAASSSSSSSRLLKETAAAVTARKDIYSEARPVRDFGQIGSQRASVKKRAEADRKRADAIRDKYANRYKRKAPPSSNALNYKQQSESGSSSGDESSWDGGDSGDSGKEEKKGPNQHAPHYHHEVHRHKHKHKHDHHYWILHRRHGGAAGAAPGSAHGSNAPATAGTPP